MRIASFLVVHTVLAFASGVAFADENERPNQGNEKEVRRDGSRKVDLHPPITSFLRLFSDQLAVRAEALDEIRERWNDSDTGLILEAIRFNRNPATRTALFDFLATQTGQSFGKSFNQWYRWIWNQEIQLHPDYATFKRQLYRRIDPRFAEYFSADLPSTIRMDEIRWGGVRRDGIPPLDHPKTIAADDADFLADSDVVFGVSFGGKSRAYPKRILAWHEMVKDTVGGGSINGVYCTLCGSMIVYDPNVDGRHHELGTSGFLYRSNKLMYDHDTKSMWSTLKGTPVVGPLVGQNIRLQSRYVVTTTWGQWKADHPDTDVLSLETGHDRDYGEGVAYHDYFATDELMFAVPKTDPRLKNKDEVLIIRDQDDSVAISADFLSHHQIYPFEFAGSNLVIITDKTGANRVYESGAVTFDGFRSPSELRAGNGQIYRINEDALVPLGHRDALKPLPRFSAHRAFWFGWFADNPDVRLIK